MLLFRVLTLEHLDEIESRATAATVGPWTAQGEGIWSPYSSQCNGEYCDDPVLMYAVTERQAQARDVQFIAHARADVPALVAEVRHYRKLLRDISVSLSDAGVGPNTIHGAVLELIQRAEATAP